MRGAWGEQPFDLAGEHYDVVGARTRETPDPMPPIYFGGSSPAAGPVAARHSDVYLTWGEPPAQVAEKVQWIRGLAEEQGRKVRFGIRLHTIARDSSEEAWRHAQWLLDALDPADVAEAQQAMAASESVGQQRMTRAALGSRGRRATSSRSPRTSGPASVWCAVAPARRWWAATRRSPTGSRSTPRPASTEFIFSGYPHLEEAHWFGEGVMPVLRSRGRLA